MMIDLNGQKFGRLQVVSRAQNHSDGSARWVCRCDCGKEKSILGTNLRNGHCVSCGCYGRETKTKHGLGGTRIYSTWKRIIGRCYNKNHDDFKYYGGRGIVVCESIRSSALNLFALLGDCPIGLTIERVNNDGNYSCGSCAECLSNGWTMNLRWATRFEQSQNTRRVKRIQIGSEIKTITEWARSSGIHIQTILSRIRTGRTGSEIIAPAGLARRMQ